MANVVLGKDKNASIKPDLIEKEQASQWMRAQPVTFLENKGQMTDMEGNPVPYVLFKAEAKGMDMYVTEKGLSYVFLKTVEDEKKEGVKDKPGNLLMDQEKKSEWSLIGMNLEGASIRKENIIKEEKSENFSQYFFKHCPEGITGVHSYKKLTIKNVYPGIDWVLYNSDSKGFKYDFIVHPGADPKQIKLVYSSLERLKINSKGELEIKTGMGGLTEQAPFSFIRETNKKIESGYQITSSERSNGYYQTTVNFQLSGFQLSTLQTLVIDPQLVWCTNYGGGVTGPMSIDCDQAGNVFVTGYGISPGIPVLNPGGGAYFQGTGGGGNAAFILKFSNTGVLIWATYYGTGGAQGICTDPSGNIFVTGLAGAGFPVLNPGGGAYFQGAVAGNSDVFILKFNNSGVRLWATYYGGSTGGFGDDYGFTVCSDPIGNIFVTGQAGSTNFPVLNPGGGAYFQGANAGGNDAFILKFDNSGVRLWATYYGGSAEDYGYAVCTDPSGTLFATGTTHSLNFPTLNPGGGAYYQAASGGGNGGSYGGDCFVLKFTNAGLRQWATYYGEIGSDAGHSICNDALGNVFVTGVTQSANLPLLNPGGGAYFQGTLSSFEAFILKFNNAGLRLWATFYGGSGWDAGFNPSFDNIAVDTCTNVYISFMSNSTDIPVYAPSCNIDYYDNSLNGSFDIFITKFTNTGVRLLATYFGGNGADFRHAVAVDKFGNFFITGESQSTNTASFPLTNPGGGAYYSGTHPGGECGYIAKLIPPIFTLVPVVTSAGCNCAGTASVTVTAVCTSHTFVWYNSSWTSIGSGQAISNLCAGNYQVIARDTINCLNIDTAFVTVTGSGGLTLTNTQTNINCNGGSNGTASVTATAGTNPYTYSWNNGQTTASSTGLSAGTYIVTITDANGCTGFQTIVITQPAALTSTIVSANINCNGASNGTAAVTATGGTGAYTYSWNPGGATSSTVTGLSSGTYTLTITDANGCTGTKTTTITQPAALTSTVAPTNVSCNGANNGSAAATAGGGTGAYTYSWSNSQTGSSATNLGAGTYTVTVTDNNGCTISKTVNVTEPLAISLPVTIVNTNCGQSNGSATATASGGTGSFTYSWSTGGTQSSVSNLSAATYTVTATDGNGCTTSTTVLVGSSVNGTASITLNNNVSCNNGGNGSATASMTGGTSPYTYSWSSGQAVSTATGLSSGVYTCIVTDINGCTSSQTVNITEPTAISLPATSVNASCGQSNGSASATASGGTGSFTYSWSTGGTQSSVSNLSAATYTVTVADGNGCSTTSTVLIGSNGGGTASITLNNNVSCNSGSNGSATASMSGGTSPYTYSWNNGQTTINATGLTAGIYTITVTDATGCTSTQTVNVSQPSSMNITASSINANCGAADGSASVTANGGTGTFTYAWNNGQTTQQCNNLSAGQYTVVVTDANGCSITTLANIGQNGGPTANAGNNVTIQSGSTTNLNGSGASSYSWSPSSGLSCSNCSNPTASPTITTQYCLTVTDVNGCSDSACVTVFVETTCPSNNDFQVPNAFSPNGDGHNDELRLNGWKGCITEIDFVIYDRWGEKVFETRDPDKGWDGSYRGQVMDAAVFAYYISATNKDGKPFVRKGNISLLR